MRKILFYEGSFPDILCTLPLCEEINYMLLPGEVWNKTVQSVLIDVDIFFVCFQR